MTCVCAVDGGDYHSSAHARLRLDEFHAFGTTRDEKREQIAFNVRLS
jgi:hypothetical protein